ncbi:hypothetical protein EUAN_12400 [Andreesenia angusta]|uniref:Phage protein n=1 Tax=Andreesenia angusta TaxID=39480 RepID=A0A1S1V6B0_9FIRM|nr:hypothetical protein [Andreesenia angusta]OHW62171.1 hypothetical protein EUAN_12400 [Andreesenia angusta]
MITVNDIYKEIARVLKVTFPMSKVYRDTIESLVVPAFNIQLVVYNTVGFSEKVINRKAKLDIVYLSESNTRESLEAAEKLTSLFMPSFKIKDRHITMNESPEVKIIDKDLHYLVTFDFFDTFEKIIVNDDGTITVVDTGKPEVDWESGKTLELMERLFVDGEEQIE